MAEEEPTIEELEQMIPDVRIILTDDGHTVMLFRDREGRSGKQFLSVYRKFFQRLIGRCGKPDQGGTVHHEGHDILYAVWNHQNIPDRLKSITEEQDAIEEVMNIMGLPDHE